MKRVLVAGIGNIFLGDDGFGVEVARRLATAGLPPQVQVADYGISGLHLAYELLDGYDTTILVDAAPRGGEPGTVYVIEPGDGGDEPAGPLDAHGMQPDVVLRLLRTLGGDTRRVLVVGCEPADVGEGIGLSPRVAAAVPAAVELVMELACGPAAATVEPGGAKW
ncbi:hydrogenase maturation protease [Amycolatopsis acidiphila]|uniref:hydrogenase maturation protease n=1 Tax=Amycolatopsis acidiphila TaxID=715473 RepID=UPI0019C4383D|nr:hydrogenase maturation protease [Amycolatopsis acidiphila]UIJ56492.1 hydrogenase maturation protease [Amycolatopsis acidiphila]GHG66971.1 peptidase M52 [Amycolatopsis acidiphila]